MKEDLTYAARLFAANVVGSVIGHAIWEHVVLWFAKVME